MAQAIITYMAVPHSGYLKFFNRHKRIKTLYIMGPEIINEFSHLYKDIHALPTPLLKTTLESWGYFTDVIILDTATLQSLKSSDITFIMPDEDITRIFAEKHFPLKRVKFDGTVFLRWDKHNTVLERPVQPDITITEETFDKQMMQLAYDQRSKSSDWWRQVGSVLVKDAQVLLTGVNQHVPSPHIAYAEGNPRNNFSKGVNLELITTIHGEAAVIAEAAKRGVSTEGSSLYVSTFPCPPCAKLIAYAGIKRLYFHSGYGVTDGERILKDNKVELIYVDMADGAIDNQDYAQYEK